jgi:hypothetical protein
MPMTAEPLAPLKPQLTVIRFAPYVVAPPDLPDIVHDPDLAMYKSSTGAIVIAESDVYALAVWEAWNGTVCEERTAWSWERVADNTIVTLIDQNDRTETTASALTWTGLGGRGYLGQEAEAEDIVQARLEIVRWNFEAHGWIDPVMVGTLLTRHASTDIDAYAEPEDLGPTLLRRTLRQPPDGPLLVSSEIVRQLAHRMLTLVQDRETMNQRTSEIHPDPDVRHDAAVRSAAYRLVLFDLCQVLNHRHVRELAGSPTAFLDARERAELDARRGRS